MDRSSELLALETRRCDAMVTADINALETLLADTLTWTHSSARQDTKASFLAGLSAGGTRYLEITRSDERVRVHGDVAVITGVVDMRASIKGEEKQLRNRYTNVWAKTGERWQMVAWQSTAVPQMKTPTFAEPVATPGAKTMSTNATSITVEQVLALEDERYAAMTDGDLTHLERMLADDLGYTHSSSLFDTKATYIEAIRKAEFTYRSVERSEAKVVFAGGAALVTGRIRLDVLFPDGPRVIDSRFLSVWIKLGERWRHTAWQSTPLPATSAIG